VADRAVPHRRHGVHQEIQQNAAGVDDQVVLGAAAATGDRRRADVAPL
jgi:hypothetical protein